MTIREKLGQMVMAGFPGETLDDEFRELIRSYNVTNIILFSHNIKDREQLRGLCREIQDEVCAAAGVPALIAIDQEGGMVSRLPKDMTGIPGAMAVAATGDPENAYRIGSLTARGLRSVGVNFNLAPSLDINSNRDNPVIGVRSYGDTAETVSAYGIRMMRGLLDGGVLSAVKHFPGHGDTAVDSHVGLPRVEKTERELMECELIPFRRAIEAGAPCVMTSHILFPKLEKEKIPATMSGRILTGLLRGKLGFDGLIITDCLEMGAIRDCYGTEKGALAAVNAGADMVCISHTASLAESAIETMERALRNGELSMERVDEAVRRVRRVRAMCRAFPEDLSPGQREEDRREAERVSLNSITAVRLHGEMPILGPDTLYAGSYAARSTLASSSVDRSLSFPHFLAERLGGTPLVTPIDPNPEEIEKVLAAAASLRCRNAVVGLYNGQFNRGQLSLVGALCEAGLRVAAVSLRNPYDLSMADERADAFAAYEYTELAFGSLVRLFRERKRPEGKLSVRL